LAAVAMVLCEAVRARTWSLIVACLVLGPAVAAAAALSCGVVLRYLADGALRDP